jgi:hypothetical protein
MLLTEATSTEPEPLRIRKVDPNKHAASTSTPKWRTGGQQLDCPSGSIRTDS